MQTNSFRFLRGLAGLMLILAVQMGTARAGGRGAILEAIHHLENPRNLSRPGPRGELGAYQFRAATWRMHTAVPFSRALERPLSDEIALRHYAWLKQGLESARLPATPYNIALAWNGGLRAAVQGRAPRAAHDYAQRAAQLAAVYIREPRFSAR